MKKSLFFTLVAMFLLLTSKSFSQSEEKSSSYFSNTDNTVSTKDLTITRSIDPTFYNNQKSIVSSVYLSQIGDKNAIDVVTESGSSQRVHQQGDQNFYMFRDSNSDVKVNFGVRQTGDANSLKIFGTNSSMQNAVFNQYGGAKATVNYYKY